MKTFLKITIIFVHISALYIAIRTKTICLYVILIAILMEIFYWSDAKNMTVEKPITPKKTERKDWREKYERL